MDSNISDCLYFFVAFLKQNHLEQVFTILQSNGFDDWKSISQLNDKILSEIGIEDSFEIEKILECVQKSEKGWKDSKKLILDKNLLYRGIFSKREKNMTEEKFLNSLTNMILNDREIYEIGNGLSFCKNLHVLQLCNNRIEKIQNLNSLKSLKILRLEYNLIKNIEGLDNLTNLEKLYLNNNEIPILQNLDHQTSLQELYISNQRIGGIEFRFIDKTMKSLSISLQLLDCGGNNIKNPNGIEFLSSLRALNFNDNKICTLEIVGKIIPSLKNLISINLRDNPVSKISKIRDQIIMISSENLEEIDDKKILPKEREFIFKFYNIKNSRGNKPKMLKENNDVFEINGKEIREWNNPSEASIEEPKTINRGLNVASDFRNIQPYMNSKWNAPKK